MTISQEIKKVVTRFHVIHKSVLSLYLSRYYNQSKELTDKSIHKAAVARICYELADDFIGETPFSEVTSTAKQMSRAFRVAIEFMKIEEYSFLDSRVLAGNDCNTLLLVTKPPNDEVRKNNAGAQSSVIQISYIPRGNEVVTSQMMASVPVADFMRKMVIRIGIVETGFRLDYIGKVGFSMLIHFGKDQYTFETNDIITIEKEGRWDDVKSKAK